MEASSVFARRRGAGRFCPPHGAEAAASAIRAEKILPDAAQLGERIDLVLRHLPERRASGADRIVLGCGVPCERRRGCETNQRCGKRGGGEAKIHGGGSRHRNPALSDLVPWRLAAESVYKEQGAFHRPAREHAGEAPPDPAAADPPPGPRRSPPPPVRPPQPTSDRP